MTTLQDIDVSDETKAVLGWFEEITKIPRPSEHEEKIRTWLQGWSEQRGFQHRVDSVGNLLIEVPGSAGREGEPKVILQGHMDMVCEKTPDSSHDFSKDPLQLVYDGDWLRAHQTTLGADNGIAIALALAIADAADVAHPPLELLFTVEEETCLAGANQLDQGFLEGKTLLNIDSEDEGVFTVGCAGGINAEITVPLAMAPIPADWISCRLTVGGLRGGHSGIDIVEGRSNAIISLARSLQQLSEQFSLCISEIKGGSAHNAIPRDASAQIHLSPADLDAAKAVIATMASTLQAEFSQVDPGLSVALATSDATATQATSPAATQALLDVVLALPDGVVSMAAAIPGLVETSCNLATIALDDQGLQLISSLRSSVASRLDALLARVKAVGRLAGGTIETNAGYPPWEPHWDSPLLAQCKQIYEETFDKEPVIEVIHAGLECGIIGAKYPGMDMISLGPTIKYPHSPDECLKISDIDKVWQLLVALLKAL